MPDGERAATRPRREAPLVAEQRLIDFRTVDGLAYLEAVVDLAPVLTARRDMPDPLTDWWKGAIRKLIAVAKEQAE